MLPKAYDPQGTEDRIYKMWEESGAFKPDEDVGDTFTISMPPPNATGQLHLGHAVMLALEDIFIRFNRMQGKAALWVPGTDHAAIATESVVIKKIQKEEKMPDPRGSLGREELLRRIQHFVDNSKNTIRSQIRKMGSSCDWSREGYTMEPALNRIVNEMFVKMCKDGLIYRGERVVNWDTALQTTISDDEIEHEDSKAVLYTFEYLSAEQTKGEPLFVATSRPETKLADTALAVHPDDKRYKKLIGKDFDVQWPQGRKIHVNVIADHTVDPEFGTGVVGITPFHSKIDYEIWQRHKEEIRALPVQLIGEDGLILKTIDGYAGLSVIEARELMVEGLRKQGRLKSEEEYLQPLSISYRSKKPVEPLPKLQWFIDVNKKVDTWQGKWKGKKMSLKEVMQDTVKNGDINIIPDRFEKTYFHWIDNLQDWCISRQIWWGHQVPVWYCASCNPVFGSRIQAGDEAPEIMNSIREQSRKNWDTKSGAWEGIFPSVQPLQRCPKCGMQSPLFFQDEDTLDTWFSSALWTWSTLIDKGLALNSNVTFDQLLESGDFKKFHPTQVMETGYDILFFWVARMILMTTYGTGQIPFEKVYLHGLIRTRDGAKMSKSHPETMIDPLDIISKYGADALRMSMIVGQSPGNDQKLFEEKIAGYRNFVNKLWNASRFVLMKCEEAGVDPHALEPDVGSERSLVDKALFQELLDVRSDVTFGLERYRLSEVGERLYSFVWDYYCDWYLEFSKEKMNIHLLVFSLREILQLLHPYCPFVTEEIWSHVKHKDAGMLISHRWPLPISSFSDEHEQFQLLIECIKGIRSLRSEEGVPPEEKVRIFIKPSLPVFSSNEEHIKRLASVDHIMLGSTIRSDGSIGSPDTFPFFTGTGYEIILFRSHAYDPIQMKNDLKKRMEDSERFKKGILSKLNNARFRENAAPEVIALEEKKLSNTEQKLRNIERRLKGFNK